MFSIFAFVLALALSNAWSSRRPRVVAPQTSRGEAQGKLQDDIQTESGAPGPPDFYALRANDLEGNEISMSQFKGSVLYIANVATY